MSGAAPMWAWGAVVWAGAAAAAQPAVAQGFSQFNGFAERSPRTSYNATPFGGLGG